ncbi:TonB-dependent receptor domain-containing protein [Frateuria aurantia]
MKKQASKLAAIEVTGTHIRRVDVETASPLVVIDSQQLTDSGKPTAGDLLQQLPQMAGTMSNPSFNSGFSHGEASVSLRGLGSERTLVLVNGHRLAEADVNSIPSDMIERIEVLTSGASSAYGSDAIAGVVNFILKDHYNGLHVSTDYGISTYGDGERKNYQLTWGKGWHRGSLMVGLTHNDSDAIASSNRAFSRYVLTDAAGVVSRVRSSYTPGGKITLADGSGPYTLVPGTGNGLTSLSDYTPYTSTDGYNTNAVGLLTTPVKRTNFTTHGTFDLTANTQLYIDTLWNHTNSQSVLAPYPLSVSVAADSYYNPFGQTVTDLVRPTAVNRTYNSTTNNMQFTPGIKGSFGDSAWQWDANISYAHWKDKITEYGQYNTDELAQSLGASFMDSDGQVVCGTPGAVIANCTPVNIFNTSDPATIAALRKDMVAIEQTERYTMKQAEASVNGPLWGLPAGDVQAAFGILYRHESLASSTETPLAIKDPVTGSCALTDCISDDTGTQGLSEAYGELLIPLLKELPAAQSLNLDIGTRYSHYSEWGSTLNTKLALEWRPVSDLLVRASAAQVFRAPTINDLYAAASQGSSDYIDPCNGYTGGHGKACTNVPTTGTFTQTSSDVTYISEGSALSHSGLQPEHGRTYDLGLVYDPAWLPGLSVNVDQWRVVLNQMISDTPSINWLLNKCYSTGQYCNMINRNASGQVTSVYLSEVNLGKMDIRGYDFGFKYALPSYPVGRFSLGLNATYLDRYYSSVDHYNYAGVYSATEGNLTRWRAQLGLNWDHGPWHASWAQRYVGRSQVGNDVDGGLTDADGNYLKVTPRIYSDVSLTRRLEAWHLNLSVGVDNLFNRTPPYFYDWASNSNTDVSTYDSIGRYYWTRISFDLK